VDFSKLKLEVYDFLGIIVPGLLAIGEGWVFLRGWAGFAEAMKQISGSAFTIIAACAFAAGNPLQELGEVAVTMLKGKRYLRQGRDRFWATDEGKVVRAFIKTQSGADVNDVDTAFDYCLTKLKDDFPKRDAFVATSDLCRSLVILSALAIAPVIRAIWSAGRVTSRSLVVAAGQILFLLVLCALSWRRMVRFRDLSETTVFRAYLAVSSRT
jgi:hypothetical protein